MALSAILTACTRPSLRAAPLHGFSAPEAGSGKSTLVDVASVIAHGHEAPVKAQGATEEEFEKSLASMLLAGDSIVAIDNCARPLEGDLLCQMLTQSMVRVRILGLSRTPELPAVAFVAATGNNLTMQGDLTRRALLCRIDAKVERPETRVFDRDPIATVKAMRPVLLVAALTALRAFHVAGRPGTSAPLGSFEDWSNLVRGALIWLGCADPVELMKSMRQADPTREAMRAVAAQWSAVIGPEPVTAAEAIGKAIEMRRSYDDGGGNEFVHADFREALVAVAGKAGALSTRLLGMWLMERQDRIVDGLRFVKVGDRNKVALWAVRRGT